MKTNIIIIVYSVLLVLLYMGYASTYFEWNWVTVSQLLLFREIMEGLLALYLIVRFHPFQQKHTFYQEDGTIVFASATFLFFNVLIEYALLRSNASLSSSFLFANSFLNKPNTVFS